MFKLNSKQTISFGFGVVITLLIVLSAITINIVSTNNANLLRVGVKFSTLKEIDEIRNVYSTFDIILQELTSSYTTDSKYLQLLYFDKNLSKLSRLVQNKINNGVIHEFKNEWKQLQSYIYKVEQLHKNLIPTAASFSDTIINSENGAKLYSALTKIENEIKLLHELQTASINKSINTISNYQNNDYFLIGTLGIIAVIVGWFTSMYVAQNNSNNEDALTQQIKLAQSANKMKSIFLSNMSHEIRTPLNAVLGFAQLLLRNPNFPDEYRNSAKSIENSGTHLLDLINEVLDLSKIEMGMMVLNPTEFNINKLVSDMSDLLAQLCKEKSLSYKVNNQLNTYDQVYGDITKLRQILTNLIANAVKFTEKGHVIFTIYANDDTYTFSIIDSGIGIAISEQCRIFEPFMQTMDGTKKGGTGLGLAIAKKQLEIMNSELLVQSHPNEGSTFSFTVFLAKYHKRHLQNRDALTSSSDKMSLNNRINSKNGSENNTDPNNAEISLRDLDLNNILIPDRIYTELNQAVNMNALTKIDKLIIELECEDKSTSKIAPILKNYLKIFEMEKIRIALKQVANTRH